MTEDSVVGNVEAPGGEASSARGVGGFLLTLGVWDDDWLVLGHLKTVAVLPDGMALKGG